ncbi:MAG: acyl-ACP thioesterase domain-containing protein [Acidimicrobiales bacterium]
MEFAAWVDGSRRYLGAATVRLGDVDPNGRLRVDALARYLQDVATDDWNDTGLVLESDDVWLVRRTGLRRVAGARWPGYLEGLELATWCAGTGGAWAERRTDVLLDGVVVIETVALWVPTDLEGRPVRMRESFFAAYGEAARARRVSSRVGVPPMSEGATRRPWPTRRSDLDLVGHVNNAAVWEVVTEVAPGPLGAASVVHHGALERGDDVALVEGDRVAWLVVGDEVRVSATYAT